MLINNLDNLSTLFSQTQSKIPPSLNNIEPENTSSIFANIWLILQLYLSSKKPWLHWHKLLECCFLHTLYPRTQCQPDNHKNKDKNSNYFHNKPGTKAPQAAYRWEGCHHLPCKYQHPSAPRHTGRSCQARNKDPALCSHEDLFDTSRYQQEEQQLLSE